MFDQQNNFGFDYVIDYKTCETKEDLVKELKLVAPNGIDMYFDNVGGIHFEAAMDVLANHGRVAICGSISGYNSEVPSPLSFYPMKMIYSCQ